MAEDTISLHDYIVQKANELGVPPELALAIAEQESGPDFNPHAVGPLLPEGDRALGTMQLRQATAKRLGVDPNDATENINGGVQLLQQLLHQYAPSPADLNEQTLGQIIGAYGGVRTNQTYVPEVRARITKFQKQLDQQSADEQKQIATAPPPPQYGLTASRRDLPRPIDWTAQPTDQDVLLQNAKDIMARGKQLGIGAVRSGAAGTAIRAGQLVQQIPGVAQATDYLYGLPPGSSKQSMRDALTALEPQNRTQRVGKAIEQMAEIALGQGAIAGGAKAVAAKGGPLIADALQAIGYGPKVAGTIGQVVPEMAVQAAGGAGLSALQGADPRIGAAINAAIPAISAVATPLAQYLKSTAAKKVVQALGPTGQRNITRAERIAPGVLERGLGGSRESLKAQAGQALDQVTPLLDQAIATHGQTRVPTGDIWQALESLKPRFQNIGPSGNVIELNPRALRQIEGLQSLILEHGADASVDQLINVRKAWDLIVDQAGGYTQRAPGGLGMDLDQASEAWAKREGTKAIRAILGQRFPDLAALNKEWSFWMDLKNVVSNTLQRTEPQRVGIIPSMGARFAGGLAGLRHGVMGMFGGMYIGEHVYGGLMRMLESPRVLLLSANVRNRIANAMMNQDTTELAKIIARYAITKNTQVAQPPLPPVQAGQPPPAPPDVIRQLGAGGPARPY